MSNRKFSKEEKLSLRIETDEQKIVFTSEKQQYL